MQEQFIDVGAQALNPSATAHESFAEKAKNAKESINKWLDCKNETYSRIADFSVTNRVVVRVNIVTVLLLIGALAIAAAPVASVLSIAASCWLTYQYNHKPEKKGGKA